MDCAVAGIHGYGRGVTSEGSRRNKSQGVKMDGKVRETTVTTQGAGCEDKTCNTSEPAHHPTEHSLPLFFPTHSVVKPGERMDSVDMKPSQGSGQATGESERGFGAKTRHLRNDLGARDTGSGMARLVADGRRRRNLTIQGTDGTRTDSNPDGKTNYTDGRTDGDRPRIRRQGKIRTLTEAVQPVRQGRIDEAKTVRAWRNALPIQTVTGRRDKHGRDANTGDGPESQGRRTSRMARANGDGFTQGLVPSVGAARQRSTTLRERTSRRTERRRLWAGGSRARGQGPQNSGAGSGLIHYAKSRDYKHNHTAQSGASRCKTSRTRGRDGDSQAIN
ncbi:hypothetical protein A4X13_0g7638 [Tilletia indica]|uniref:Uncharacterized protein n=1 Tax=Tilletia indica TaxID=43049 RepID=A0A8T8SIM0_9BASI|nr:hypothetical protein A4X13_0g7638 [Tilletia indica]